MNHRASTHGRHPSSPKKSPIFPGGEKTFFGTFQRVKIEGRRGRGYWEWKSAESKKEKCGHEGDDEMTSLESDTLKRHKPPVGRSREDALCSPRTCGIKVLPPFSSPKNESFKSNDTSKGNNDHGVKTVNTTGDQKPLKSILVKGHAKKEHAVYTSPQSPSAPPKELVCADAKPPRDERRRFILGHDNKLVDRSSHTKFLSELDTNAERKQNNSVLNLDNSEAIKCNHLGSGGISSSSYQPIKGEHYERRDTDNSSQCFVSKKDTFSKEDNYLKCQNNKPLYPIIPKDNLVTAPEKTLEYEPDSKPLLHDTTIIPIPVDNYKEPVIPQVNKCNTSTSRIQIHSQSSSSVTASSKPSANNSKKQNRKSGALVWVNQPGGGAKLEWIPTAGLSTIRTVPPRKSLSSKIPPLSSTQVQESDSGVAAGSNERASEPSTKTSITRDDQGDIGGENARGKDGRTGKEARAEETDVTRAASVAVSVDCDGSVGHCEGNGCLSDRDNEPNGCKSSGAGGCEVVTLGNVQSPKYSRQKNVYSSVPGEARPAGRTNPRTGILSGGGIFRRSQEIESGSSSGEDRIVSVAGRNQGQVVRIRVRPEVHAYLANLPVINSGFGFRQHQNRRDSFQSGNSSTSCITWGSGEASVGYQEEEYSAVVDEYTLLKRAVDDQDPEALRLLTETESAISSGKNYDHEEVYSTYQSRVVSYSCMEKTM